MNLITLLLFCITFQACTARYADFFPYYNDGTKKPSLSLLPVYNSVPGENSFAQAFGQQIRTNIRTHGKIYCPPVEDTKRVLQSVSLEELSHTTSFAPFQKFKGTDYVCVIELTDYNIVPYKRNTIEPLYIADLKEGEANVLKIAARLTIVDIKGANPKYVRQELMQSNHMIPLDPEDIDFKMIRSRFARDVEQKIEQTVCVKQ